MSNNFFPASANGAQTVLNIKYEKKKDLQSINLSGTYCHKTGKRTPNCNTP